MDKCKLGIGAHILTFLLIFMFSQQFTIVKAQLSAAEFSNSLYNAIKIDLPANHSYIMASSTIRDNLVMLYLGASGPTKDQIHDSLEIRGYKDIVAVTYNTPYSINTKRLNLTLSNTIYVNDQLALSNRFMQLTNSFRLKRKFIDFRDTKSAAQRINELAQEFTQRDLVTALDLSPNNGGILTSVIRLDAVWKNPFDKIAQGKFYTGREDYRVVTMLQQVNEFRYNRIDRIDAEVIELPLDRGVSVMVFLPNLVENGIPDLETALSKENVFNIAKELNATKIRVQLPQFKISTKIKLKKPLQRLGITLAFTKKADFHETFIKKNKETQSYINEVIQMASINIDAIKVESGAAGASSTVLRKNDPEFIVNRPFVFAILDSKRVYMEGRFN